MNKADKIILAINGLFIGMMITLTFNILVNLNDQKKQISRLEVKQVKLEKRVDNLTAAMQTKDKELENGLRNNYNGLMYKID